MGHEFNLKVTGSVFDKSWSPESSKMGNGYVNIEKVEPHRVCQNSESFSFFFPNDMIKSIHTAVNSSKESHTGFARMIFRTT
jgi:hypothetical protein